MALLEAERLTKDFGGLRAVDDLGLQVQEGEIVGLIGPNGSGKTTVFNLITGIYPATAGRISFDHGRRELVGLAAHRITGLGIARTFQNQRLFNQMTVAENVLVGTHCRTRAGIATVLLSTPGSRAERRRAEARASELIRQIRDRGVTILLIEHDMGVVRGICQRVVALDHGTKIAEGPFEEVRRSPAVLEAYLGRRAGRA